MSAQLVITPPAPAVWARLWMWSHHSTRSRAMHRHGVLHSNARGLTCAQPACLLRYRTLKACTSAANFQEETLPRARQGTPQSEPAKQPPSNRQATAKPVLSPSLCLSLPSPAPRSTGIVELVSSQQHSAEGQPLRHCWFGISVVAGRGSSRGLSGSNSRVLCLIFIRLISELP